MKKLFLFVVLLAFVAVTTQKTSAQTGIQIIVHGQLTGGDLSGGLTPLCYGNNVGLISGTLPTGGEGSYTYQWQRSIDNNATWSNIIGATGQNYDPSIVYVSTNYRRIVTDPCNSIASDTISITVYGQFITGTTTGGNTPICDGDDAGIVTSTAETGGAPGTTYQWQQSIDAGATWTDIFGATALTYAIGSLNTTTSFRLAFINPTCGTNYGNTISITVYPVFASGTVTGGNSPICHNTNAGILTSTAPTGGAPGTTLQWESSTDGLTYNPIAGQTTLTLTLGNLLQTMWYRLAYTNACGVLYSNITNIVVYNQFVAGVSTLVGTDTICNGNDAGNITGTAATGGAPGTTYQWQSSIDGGVSWTNIVGETLSDYDIPALTTTTTFRRQDINSCTTLYTNSITITVYSVFASGTIGVSQAICYGAIPNQLINVVAPSGGSGIYTYQWQESTDGGVTISWTDVIGETNPTFQPPSLTSGIWYRRIVIDANGCGSLPSLP
jgi:hypothetical protein